MITAKVWVIDYNRSPSTTIHRVTLYGHPAKGDTLERLEAFAHLDSPGLVANERTFLSGVVSKVIWYGASQLNLEVLGCYSKETHGPVSP